MSVVQRLAERGIARPPKFLPTNTHYETMMGSVAYGVSGDTSDVAVDLLNCDREAGSYMLPLGVVRAKDHVYWLAQFSGWDHERFVVVEMQKKNVEAVINAWGGSCESSK